MVKAGAWLSLHAFAAHPARKDGNRGTSHSDSPLCCFLRLAVKGYIKLAIDAGKANPAPPIGPALGSKVGAALASSLLSLSILLLKFAAAEPVHECSQFLPSPNFGIQLTVLSTADPLLGRPSISM